MRRRACAEFLYLVLTLASAAGAPAAEPTETVLVRRDALGARSLPEAQRRIDYESFVWLDLTVQQRRVFDAARIAYEPRPDAMLVPLSGRSLDTSTLPFPVAQGGNDDAGLFLLQLAGPLKKEWMPAILEKGVRVVASLAPFNLIVWSTSPAMAPIASLPQVRWYGVWGPPDRLAPHLRNPQ